MRGNEKGERWRIDERCTIVAWFSLSLCFRLANWSLCAFVLSTLSMSQVTHQQVKWIILPFTNTICGNLSRCNEQPPITLSHIIDGVMYQLEYAPQLAHTYRRIFNI